MPKSVLTFPEHRLLQQMDEPPKVVLELSLPAELIFFEGHFPEKAILPAVSQIFMAERLFKHHCPVKLSFVALKRLKFRRPIVPVDRINLELSFNPDKTLLSFRYYDDQETKSTGHIQFEAQP
jgi:3-hydroxymyristoyl/3-hydroxydecanoyl-(acyl carrier protein) dehydratase